MSKDSKYATLADVEATADGDVEDGDVEDAKVPAILGEEDEDAGVAEMADV